MNVFIVTMDNWGKDRQSNIILKIFDNSEKAVKFVEGQIKDLYDVNSFSHNGNRDAQNFDECWNSSEYKICYYVKEWGVK